MSTPASDDREVAEKAARRAALMKVYGHFTLCCAQTVMPFAQKQQVIQSLAQFRGDPAKAAVFSATLSSASGITEFVLCPLLGKMSDATSRKTFLKLGPIADIIAYFLVFAKPSVQTLWLQAVLGTPLNTFSGSTLLGASITDIFDEAKQEMGMAFGGILTCVGIGLTCGPQIGKFLVKQGGSPQYAYLGASLCACLQLLNVQTMDDTLKAKNRKPFEFAIGDLNPFTFLKLFTLKGRSALLKLSLMTAFFQKADEGKNLADLHQVYSAQDLDLSKEVRGNFVSMVGLCVIIGNRFSDWSMRTFGGHGHTSLSNLVSVAACVYFATVPRGFKTQWWPMYAGLLFSSLGWNADTHVKACAAGHANAAGLGNGEYNAMLGNLRSVMTSLAPTLYTRVYQWSTSGGRNNPGLAYLVAALFKVVAQLFYQSMSANEIDNPSK
jgi:MFS family permease